MDKFVYQGRKLISEVKRIACMPLKEKKKTRRLLKVTVWSQTGARQLCLLLILLVIVTRQMCGLLHFLHDSGHSRSTRTHVQKLEGVCPLVEEGGASVLRRMSCA